MKTKRKLDKEDKKDLDYEKYQDFFKYLGIDPKDFDDFDRIIDFDDYSR